MGDHLREVHPAGDGQGLEESLVVGPGGVAPCGPGRAGSQLQAGEPQRRCGRVGGEGEGRGPDPAQFGGIGMNVDQSLRGLLRREQGVALGRVISEPRAESQDHVSAANPLHQLRIGGEAQVAGVAGAVVVQQVLSAEGKRSRQVVRLEPGAERRARFCRPAGSAEDHHRPLGRSQSHADAGKRDVVQARPRGLDPAGPRPRRWRGQQVLGQGQHDRAAAAPERDVESAVHRLGRTLRRLELGGPLGEGAEHLVVVHLLEGAPAPMGAFDLADQQDYRGGVLLCGVDADAGVGRARPPGHHANPRTAGEFAISLGHVGGSGLVPAGDQADAVPGPGQGVEHRQVALARHAENVIDAVHDQAFDNDLGGVRHDGSLALLPARERPVTRPLPAACITVPK